MGDCKGGAEGGAGTVVDMMGKSEWYDRVERGMIKMEKKRKWRTKRERGSD